MAKCLRKILVLTKIFQGNAGDALSTHSGHKFSTKDRDNDIWSGDCAAQYKGAWWHKNCHSSNLNGQYLNAGQRSGAGINWLNWKNDRRSMMKTEMKIRPA